MAIVVSAIIHLAIAVGLMGPLRWRPVAEAPQALEVEILRQPAERRAADRKPPPRSASPANPSPSPAPPAPRPVAAGASPTPSASEAPPQPSATAGLSEALRRGLACAHPDAQGLTASEREACQLREAKLARADTDGPRFGLSPDRRAIFDAEARRADVLQQPFLAERPKKGCKPTLTEQESGVVGRSPPNWTASVACGVPF